MSIYPLKRPPINDMITANIIRPIPMRKAFIMYFQFFQLWENKEYMSMKNAMKPVIQTTANPAMPM